MALQLQHDDFDLEARTLRVERALSEKTVGPPKGGRARLLPLSAEAVTSLRTLPTLLRRAQVLFPAVGGGPLNADYLGGPKVFGRLLKASDVCPIRFHDLRHTFASQLAQAGVPLGAIQSLLGHTDIQTTMRYAHLCPASMAQWTDRLDGSGGNVGNGTGKLAGNAGPNAWPEN